MCSFHRANRLKSTPTSSWPTSLNIWFILLRSFSAPCNSPDLHSLYEISRSLKNKPASSFPKIPTRKRSLKVGPNMEGYKENSRFSYHMSYCCFVRNVCKPSSGSCSQQPGYSRCSRQSGTGLPKRTQPSSDYLIYKSRHLRNINSHYTQPSGE